MTADGKTDTITRSGAIISSDEDVKQIDLVWTEVDAVMVDGRILLENDLRLTVKAEQLCQERLQRELSPNLVKVGVVTRVHLRPDSRFLNAGPERVIIFTTSQTNLKQIDLLEKQGVQVFVMGEQQVDLVLTMHKLTELGIPRMLVEGGGTSNEPLLWLRLVDEISIYIAPLIFSGVNAPILARGVCLQHQEAIQLQLIDVDMLGDGGILLWYLPIDE